ncbi:hypothetical protein BDW22DRAFT_1360878 [Trametopsis cervina]|nr:hypothetical protein BDW22DRAFT_1360878 [Trametopsis cervina]
MATPDSEVDIKYNPHFNEDDADIIIRAGDGAYFRVYKIFLSKASSVFKDMFRIPQSPSGIVDDRDHISGTPLINLSEDEQILENVFRLCIPFEDVELTDVDEIAQVIITADKYDMARIKEHAQKLWPTAAAKEPLRAFAIACKKNLREEAIWAAKLTLKEPIWPLEPNPLIGELREISADTILRLQSYHRRCSEVAVGAAKNSTWCTAIYTSVTCRYCQGSCGGSVVQSRTGRDWYLEYLKMAVEKLAVQPSGSIVASEAIRAQTMRKVYSPADQVCNMTMHIVDSIRQVVAEFGKAIDAELDRVKLDLDS